ncbi:hypothetical protein PybrP1_000089 [[Pythium] brassicae (nom. inval.)]|nr:hypothetical protein PybrP1_000089 [[Pythium] brassicae (nom. inval.)]
MLLVRAPAPTATRDPQLRALLYDRFHRFRQWSTPYAESRLATLTQLRHTLDALLPILTGARDFAGAAKVLSVVYHRFSLAPALCVQTSLEILRRHPEHKDDLLQFYLAALQEEQLDKRLLLKELWMFYVVHGDFYEAYALYKDEIQSLELQDDPRLLANFGILCYWLLFIESSELRDNFKREDKADDSNDEERGVDDEMEEKLDDNDADGRRKVSGRYSDDDDDDDDDDYDAASSLGRANRKRSRQQASSTSFDGWLQSRATPPNAESLIESRYAFKASIGVHILYQEAAAALRRAVSLCPSSAQFIEYYVQVLTLAGDVDSACDYLENFYHLNPSDPHACRMLAGFLSLYYPDSTDSQIAVYLRWLKNDPTSSFALEKIMELASAGVIASIDLVHAVVEAVDACGGELYLSKAPTVSVTLWRHLAQELAALVKSDDNGSATEALVCRAAVAYELFGAATPIVRTLCSAVHASGNTLLKPEHFRIFKSFFTDADTANVLAVGPAHTAAPVRFRDALFRHIVHRVEPNAEALPEFRGGELSGVHVMKRENVIVEADRARPRTRVEVTAENALHPVDRELVAALEEAVRDGDFAQELMDEQHRWSRHSQSGPPPEPPTTTSRRHDLAVPMYVNLIEEAAYKDREAPINHLYTFVMASLRALSAHNVIVPTLMEVQVAHTHFLERWERNEFVYGHPGLLLRYEMCLTKFVQPLVHAGIRADRAFVPTRTMVDDAMALMKSSVAAASAHFPSRHEVDAVLRVKAASLVRLRRKLLRDARRSMKHVLRKLVFLETRELASLALEVYEANGFGGCVLLEDLERAAVAAQARIYPELVMRLAHSFRTLARDTIDRMHDHGEDASDDSVLSQLLAEFKDKHPYAVPSKRQLRACIWMRKYEGVFGAFEFLWEQRRDQEVSMADDSGGASRGANSVSNGDVASERETPREEGDESVKV